MGFFVQLMCTSRPYLFSKPLAYFGKSYNLISTPVNNFQRNLLWVTPFFFSFLVVNFLIIVSTVFGNSSTFSERFFYCFMTFSNIFWKFCFFLIQIVADMNRVPSQSFGLLKYCLSAGFIKTGTRVIKIQYHLWSCMFTEVYIRPLQALFPLFWNVQGL